MGAEFAGLSDAVQEEYREDIMVMGSDEVEDDTWISDDVRGAEGPDEEESVEGEEGGRGRGVADGNADGNDNGERGGSTGDYSI